MDSKNTKPKKPSFAQTDDGSLILDMKDKTIKAEMKFSLSGTAEMMNSPDYKQRFVAEYFQTKIRYEKLRAMVAKYKATEGTGKDFLGFRPSCSIALLSDQLHSMNGYLEALEQRAVIEGIDLPNPYIGH